MAEKEFDQQPTALWKKQLSEMDPIIRDLSKHFNKEEQALLGNYLTLRGYLNSSEPGIINMYVMKRQEQIAANTIKSNDRLRKSFSKAAWALFGVAVVQTVLIAVRFFIA